MLLNCYRQPATILIQLPGSKSISNRCLILKEVLRATTKLSNLSPAKDTQDLIKALHQIREAGKTMIDIGHAGTDMRFLTALLSITPGDWIITGSARMKERPIKELVIALRSLGAEISYLEQEGFPPLKISGKELEGGKITIDAGVSSQFISALLLIAPALKQGLAITLAGTIVSRPYIQMTLDLLCKFGAGVSSAAKTFFVQGTEKDQLPHYPEEYAIEPDWTSASYWYSVVALSENHQVILPGLTADSLQGDSVLPALFKNLGVSSVFEKHELVLKKISPASSYFEYDFSDCPDLAQTVAVTCLGLKTDCKLTGLSTLKHKETNRLAALKTELEKFGAHVSITENSLELKNKKGTVTSRQETEGFPVKTYHDHRMAMSFAPLALCFSGISITDPDVVGKSYPDFWDHMKLAGISAS